MSNPETDGTWEAISRALEYQDSHHDKIQYLRWISDLCRDRADVLEIEAEDGYD